MTPARASGSAHVTEIGPMASRKVAVRGSRELCTSDCQRHASCGAALCGLSSAEPRPAGGVDRSRSSRWAQASSRREHGSPTRPHLGPLGHAGPSAGPAWDTGRSARPRLQRRSPSRRPRRGFPRTQDTGAEVRARRAARTGAPSSGVCGSFVLRGSVACRRIHPSPTPVSRLERGSSRGREAAPKVGQRPARRGGLLRLTWTRMFRSCF